MERARSVRLTKYCDLIRQGKTHGEAAEATRVYLFDYKEEVEMDEHQIKDAAVIPECDDPRHWVPRAELEAALKCSAELEPLQDENLRLKDVLEKLTDSYVRLGVLSDGQLRLISYLIDQEIYGERNARLRKKLGMGKKAETDATS